MMDYKLADAILGADVWSVTFRGWSLEGKKVAGYGSYTLKLIKTGIYSAAKMWDNLVSEQVHAAIIEAAELDRQLQFHEGVEAVNNVIQLSRPPDSPQVPMPMALSNKGNWGEVATKHGH